MSVSAARRAQERVAALYSEAEIHQSFGFRNRAAEVWERIGREAPAPSERRAALYELAKYRAYSQGDAPAGRAILASILQHAEDPREEAAILADVARMYMLENNFSTARAVLEHAMHLAPPPDATDTAWCHCWTEMLMSKGVTCWYARDVEGARVAFERVLTVTPWPNSQNAQYARQWLTFIEQHPEMAGMSYAEYTQRQMERGSRSAVSSVNGEAGQ